MITNNKTKGVKMFEFKINKIEDWQDLAEYTEKQMADFLKLYHSTIFTRDNCDRCDYSNGLMFCSTDVSITIAGKINEEEFDSIVSDIIDTLKEHYLDTGLKFRALTSFYNKVIIDMCYGDMDERVVIDMLDEELELVL
jgi:hypothetical protein